LVEAGLGTDTTTLKFERASQNENQTGFIGGGAAGLAVTTAPPVFYRGGCILSLRSTFLTFLQFPLVS
jgi:hypothetical protein